MTAASAFARMRRSMFDGIIQTAQNEPVQLLVTGQHGGHEEIAGNGAIVDVGITGVDQMAGAIFRPTVMIGKAGTHSFCQGFA